MSFYLLSANVKELFEDARFTILNADAAASAGTLTVKSIAGFKINQILCVGEIGNEKTEFIHTHASTAPSGTTITLVSNLVFAHPSGTKVYLVDFDQVEFSWCATATGTKTVLETKAIEADSPDTIYKDTTHTTGYFFTRYYNSIATIQNFSDYSDSLPIAGWAEDTVGYAMEFVRRKLGHEWDERFSQQTAMDEINACLRYMQGKLKRFSRYLVPDYVIGQTARGVFDFALPANIYDNETNKSILQVRIGTATEPLIPLDEKEFDAQMQDVVHTQVRTLAVVGDVTLAINNSYDFDDSGSVNVYTSNAVDAITYTGVTRSATAGVLTGVPATGSGAIGAAHAVDTNVWQNETEGQPRYFNVRQGRMRIWPLADSTWVNKNVVMDYNQEVTKVDSESDTIDAPRYDAVKHWLLWQGKAYWRNNGRADIKDDDFILFGDILKAAIRTEISGQKFKMAPKINQINYNARPRGKFENT